MAQGLQDTITTAQRLLVPDPHAGLDSIMGQLHVPAAVPRAAIRVLVGRQQQVWLLIGLSCYRAHESHAYYTEQAADTAHLHLQELQAAHLQVLDGYAEGRPVQDLVELARQPMPVVEAWLQVAPL